MSANTVENSNEKSAKYDRQLRLWGNHGQLSLEKSRICLLNATAVGTETLKSLVLPGIGFFTIIDDNKVTEEDVSSNFFVAADSIGQSRAKVARDLLCEMNSDVIGDYLEEVTNLVFMCVVLFLISIWIRDS
jgi:amyloid beta precursor protein binding protein 1